MIGELIKNKKVTLNIWGAGYIGISTAFNFAQSGYSVTLLDINESKINEIKKGILPINIDSVNAEEFKQLINKQKIIASTVESHFWIDNNINIICVDTEKMGEPTSDSLSVVLKEIRKFYKHQEQLLMVESTISASWIDTIILPQMGNKQHLVVAPRRDWFLEEGLNLKTLPRVVGVQDKNYESAVVFLYKQISDKIIVMSDAYHASMVKAVENSIRYINVVFANEMVSAFDNYNMAEIFEAAGTKWNIPEYHPSIGIGGYCLPLAPKYILQNILNNNEKLPMLRRSIMSDINNIEFVSNYIKKLSNGKIGVLGLSYAPDTKIWKNAPIIKITKNLVSQNVDVKINDPFYSQDEIFDIAGVESFKMDEINTENFDLIVLAACHSIYKGNLYEVLKNQTNKLTVLDNFGSMPELKEIENINYIEMGNFAEIGE